MMEFSKLVRMNRKNCNLKLTELEKLTGISASYISRIENGVNKSPSAENTILLAEALNMPLEEVAKCFSKNKDLNKITNQKDETLIKKANNILFNIAKNKVVYKEALKELIEVVEDLRKEDIYVIAKSGDVKYRVKIRIYDDLIINKVKEILKKQYNTDDIVVLEGKLLEIDKYKGGDLEEFLDSANGYFAVIDDDEYLDIKQYLNSIGY